MKTFLLGFVVLGASLQAAVLRQTLDDMMTRGKLAADLGDHAAATRAFKAVADNASAPAALRIEAHVRLGSALRSAGDHEGALAAFRRAAKDPAIDREGKALLVQALGGALPGADRWETVWKQVTFVVDRSSSSHPGLAIRWPDVSAPRAARYQGEPISLDLKDGDLPDVFRLFANIGKVAVMVDPAVQGKVTIKLEEMPWDQALEQICRTNGLTSRLENDVLWISRGGALPGETYSGEPITLDFKNGDLLDVLRLLGSVSGLNVVTAPGAGGRVTMKVEKTPWDKVLAAVLKMHGLTARREGNVLWVSSGWLPQTRAYSGKPIDVFLNDRDPKEALEGIARNAEVQLTLDPAVNEHPPVTLELTQVPWDQALDLVARMAYLEVGVDGDRRTVTPMFPKRRGSGGIRSFRVSEVRVRGIIHQKGSGYIGFIVGPDGKTYFPRVGQRLHDGTIAAIDATGVTFQEQIEGGGLRDVRKAIEPAPEEKIASWTPKAGEAERRASRDLDLEVLVTNETTPGEGTVRVRSKTSRPIVAVELLVCLREPDAQGNRRVVVSHRFSPHLGPGQDGSVPVSVARAFTSVEATMIVFGGGSGIQRHTASRSCP